MYFICICLGIFLVNVVSVHALFDSGATRSFVPLMLSNNFDDAPWMLDYPLEVEIVDDHIVNSPRVHRGCIMELFCEKYTIDMVPISLQGTKITIGIDWLSQIGL